ncbi:response regulator transcription factor [Streptomyces sp. NPDC000594]|uniref:response regulator transcription factor n=1 Tax=Streptomyces sp. NPDC000594 TaxID=3154261 RepID=UPI0033290044
MTIRVLLADDERLVLEALSALLATDEDLDIVAEATTGGTAARLARRLVPDVCALDLNLPGKDGAIGVIRELQRARPSVRYVVIASLTAPGPLRAALLAGAHGCVSKTSSARELATGIRMVHRGTRYIDPVLAAEALSAAESPLTRREADILSLAADGAPIHEVAQRAVLKPGTARNYLSSITTKLKVANRHEAAHVARRHGWI